MRNKMDKEVVILVNPINQESSRPIAFRLLRMSNVSLLHKCHVTPKEPVDGGGVLDFIMTRRWSCSTKTVDCEFVARI